MSVFREAINEQRAERSTADKMVDQVFEWLAEHHPDEVTHVRDALTDKRAFTIPEVMHGLEMLGCPIKPGETTLRRWRNEHTRG